MMNKNIFGCPTASFRPSIPDDDAADEADADADAPNTETAPAGSVRLRRCAVML